jgi:hypothetical protein
MPPLPARKSLPAADRDFPRQTYQARTWEVILSTSKMSSGFLK